MDSAHRVQIATLNSTATLENAPKSKSSGLYAIIGMNVGALAPAGSVILTWYQGCVKNTLKSITTLQSMLAWRSTLTLSLMMIVTSCAEASTQIARVFARQVFVQRIRASLAIQLPNALQLKTLWYLPNAIVVGMIKNRDIATSSQVTLNGSMWGRSSSPTTKPPRLSATQKLDGNPVASQNYIVLGCAQNSRLNITRIWLTKIVWNAWQIFTSSFLSSLTFISTAIQVDQDLSFI